MNCFFYAEADDSEVIVNFSIFFYPLSKYLTYFWNILSWNILNLISNEKHLLPMDLKGGK